MRTLNRLLMTCLFAGMLAGCGPAETQIDEEPAEMPDATEAEADFDQPLGE